MIDNITTAIFLVIGLINAVSLFSLVKKGFPLLNAIQVIAKAYLGTTHTTVKHLMINASSYVVAYLAMEYFQLVKAFWTAMILLVIFLTMDIVSTLLIALIHKRSAKQDRS